MITGLDFVYYGPEPWAGMWRNRHQLLSRLARANRVVYVEPRPYFRATLAELRSGARRPGHLFDGGLAQVADGLWAYRTPAYAAIGGGPAWRPIGRVLRVRHLRDALRRLGIGRPIVWLSHPSQADVRDDLPARLRVYHVVDEYLSYAGVNERQRAWLAACEAQIIAWADLVIAVTPELVATKGGPSKARLLPNAADVAAFDALPTPPAPLPTREGGGVLPAPARGGVGRGVTLGYAGLVGSRLDLPLLAALAAARPEWRLILVGEIVPTGCEAELARLAGLPNVTLTGPRPAAEMPGIIARWDVGLIPYRINEETRHASPLKLYEYLAAGLPVVSADVPAVRPFAGLIEITGGPEETAAAVARALAADSPAARAGRRAAVHEHSWDARVEVLSAMLAEALAEKDGVRRSA
ncbi:MAG: glycosyltransferase [Chloroflexi bacterium]|nr:glycosyltransferase [Chloroflexota bacterium]